MLAGLLSSQKAIEINIQIVRAFVLLRQYACVCVRFILTIDDKFVIFKTSLVTHLKIPIANIKNVSIELVTKLKFAIVNKYFVRCYFDFVKQTIKIQLKNGMIYQLHIKDAEKIKEEIEKRIIIPK